MNGENTKDARRFIHRAKLQQDIHARLDLLYLYIEEQAHRLDGDDTCIACGKWITNTDGLSYFEEGWLCKRCAK